LKKEASGKKQFSSMWGRASLLAKPLKATAISLKPPEDTSDRGACSGREN